MKTTDVVMAARLANFASKQANILIEDPTGPAPEIPQQERLKREQEEALKRASVLKECCNVKYTFATKKLKGGSCLLFAKEKYSYEKYRIVCKGSYPVRFKTKTSAHIAAEAIHENGIADSGYELGETYNE